MRHKGKRERRLGRREQAEPGDEWGSLPGEEDKDGAKDAENCSNLSEIAVGHRADRRSLTAPALLERR
jgi:hypothetical protein